LFASIADLRIVCLGCLLSARQNALPGFLAGLSPVRPFDRFLHQRGDDGAFVLVGESGVEPKSLSW
jgi:hypothetical protein